MSFNDRCHEALYALRSGVPIEGLPELRAALDEMLSLGAEGHQFPDRALTYAIRDRGKQRGIDLHEHICAGEFEDEYGDRSCRLCSSQSLNDLS